MNDGKRMDRSVSHSLAIKDVHLSLDFLEACMSKSVSPPARPIAMGILVQDYGKSRRFRKTPAAPPGNR